MAHVLIPLPSLDFDPTEVAVSWSALVGAGHRVTFATPDGTPAAADPIMLTGRGLDPWSPIPVIGRISLLGLLLRANRDARDAYARMVATTEFQTPTRWEHLHAPDYDGLLLGGGHRARGMRAYLESRRLQTLVAEFFAAAKPVAAICHGVLLAARSRRADGRSVLHGRKTTALSWAQERTASGFAHVGRFWDRTYYRTYTEQPGEPSGYMSVQQEVTRALASSDDFIDVPSSHPDHRRKTSGLTRDSRGDDRAAWVVRDGHYLSARWPGDAHSFGRAFAEMLSAEDDARRATP